MIKRSSKQYIDYQIEKNPDWKILDIGCGYTAHKKAKVICDVQNLSEFYKDRKFVKLNDKKLPFDDKGTLSGRAYTIDKRTFYSKNGDYIARISILISILLLLISFSKLKK